MARHIHEVPGLQPLQGRDTGGVLGTGLERQPIEGLARGLVPAVARQLDADAAVDLGHESAAVASAVRMAPPVAFAEELVRLSNQHGTRVGQRREGDIRRSRQPGGSDAQGPVVRSRGQLDGVPVLRLIGAQRNPNAHVEDDFGERRSLG